MISVSVEENEDTRIKILGHAEKSEVCHAVSGLFYALLGHLKESGCIFQKCQILEGDSEIIFKGKAKEALKMFKCGIEIVGEKYREDLILARKFAE